MSESSSPLHDNRLVDVLLRTNLSEVVNLPKTTTPFTPMLAPLNNFGVEPSFGSLLTNTSDGDVVEGTVGPNGKVINSFYFYKVSLLRCFLLFFLNYTMHYCE